MFSRKPVFIRPDDDSLYPIKNKDGAIETLINPNIDTALTIDKDAQTNFVYNRYHHLPLQAQRQKLPVFQYRNHILYLLEKYQTLILIGETGCGKSTQVPQFLSVALTVPTVQTSRLASRKISAVS
ncbi:jg11736 [Pararge aegeria aegeria]|uniref:Jg11736 protein n=1 Tax=Pararge aegeria aegeria TaxID=348720 RepID=A0A8S4SQX0_9NEOP|nr:jg11736 [Pararge aegeria aegeria]